MADQRKERIDFQKLIASSEAARATLVGARAELNDKFHLLGKIKQSVTTKPAALIGVSLLGGFLLKKTFFGRAKRISSRREDRETKVRKPERGLFLSLFALILAIAKPAAKLYATKLLKDYLEKRNHSGGKDRSSFLKHY